MQVPRIKHSFASIVLIATLVCCLILGGAMAADQGPRHHAKGQYDLAAAVYVVAPGDDLTEIGERFGVSVQDLKAQNKPASSTTLRPDRCCRPTSDSRA